jgi:choline kinase
MKSHGPRPLLRVTNELNLITHQLNVIRDAIPLNEVVLVCGHQAEKVMNNTPNDIVKIHNENYETTNVLRSIGLGLRACTTDRVLILYGDLLFNPETLYNAQLEESSVFIDRHGLLSSDSVGCTYDDNLVVEQLLYDLPNKWAQIMFVANRELALLKTVAWDRDKDKLFGFEAVNEIIKKNGRFLAQSPKNMKIIDIDSSKDLVYIKEII